MKKVAIVMGSKSDLPVLKDSYEFLKRFDVLVETRVLSAHRSPQVLMQFALDAKENDIAVIIAAAGKAAHLAGVIAAHTSVPVIGLPIKGSFLDGLDSLLSTVNMPAGVPVATVGVNASINAALLAIQIMATNDDMLYQKLVAEKKSLTDKLLDDDAKIKNQYK
jgi:5-(carboxyamino)imidazole ribonucleotide mutase